MKHVVLLKSRIGVDGGAEKYAKRLAVAFQKRGCLVSLLTTGKLPSESICEIISDEILNPFSFLRVRRYDTFCKKILPKLEADIVFGLDRNRHQTHLRASNGVHAAYLEQRKKEGSFLKRVSFPINPLHQTLLAIEKRSFEDPNLEKLFVNSHMVKGEVLRHYNTDPRKIQVFHNGVEWQEMASPFSLWEYERPRIAEELGVPANTFHFLFVGHNYRRKGLDVLLKALRGMREEEFHLSVVGKDHNIAAFKRVTADYGLQHKVSFFPAQQNVSRFYQLADALIIPSFYDPFANVTVEALAMGVFVVSSHSNGGAEVLTQDSGVIIENLHDLASVRLALKTALAKPKTAKTALQIRSSVEQLDFSLQLERLIDATIG